MRDVTYEKPKLVKVMAKAFTDFMCKHKTVPAFKMSPGFYNELLKLPESETANISFEGTVGEVMYGKVYGVNFVAPLAYTGPLTAVSYDDKTVAKIYL